MSTRTTWCRHRTPITTEYKVCKVGVNFHEFDRRSLPCFGETAKARATCPKYEGWTAEELAAREEEFQGSLRRMGVIRPAIVEHVHRTGEHSGTMTCPACKTGTLSYSQASNGHVHARCSTDGCASWME